MIGYRLKRARLAAKMSQTELGIAAGIEPESARQRVSHYETSQRTPQFQLACRFADVLDVPDCYFYIRSEDFAKKVLELYRQEKAAGKWDGVK
ncbi:helix-turn-helix domain-containing protein [Acerihabitans arboris]|uniref:Helix-turn-helix domain-containing protein n=1 Tax=Acerihabitans arboris TaxID=2691583 RepID=A0A845SV45_9GAMM|nr:helix-turn-helix transcriptional regulator [Acerihabitans arboris]NDL64845.1 helix-turn-helix domain-containing protein [Acerihabitans arboris]